MSTASSLVLVSLASSYVIRAAVRSVSVTNCFFCLLERPRGLDQITTTHMVVRAYFKNGVEGFVGRGRKEMHNLLHFCAHVRRSGLLLMLLL